MRPILICVLAAGCGGTKDTGPKPDTQADTQADTSQDTALTCPEVSDVQACQDRSDCTTITAKQVVSDGAGGWCVKGSKHPPFLGCRDAGDACSEVLTWAAPPDQADQCWLFQDSCVPDGWTDCANPDMQTSTSCQGPSR